MTDEEIRDRFTYHAPSEEGKARHKQLSDAFTQIAALVDEVCIHGREKALVFTNLEQAKMWASASVARNPATR